MGSIDIIKRLSTCLSACPSINLCNIKLIFSKRIFLKERLEPGAAGCLWAMPSPPQQNNFLSLWANWAVVGRAVAYDTTDPQFKSRHQQTFFYQLYNRKDKNKEKVAGNGPSFKDQKQKYTTSKKQNLVHAADQRLFAFWHIQQPVFLDLTRKLSLEKKGWLGS